MQDQIEVCLRRLSSAGFARCICCRQKMWLLRRLDWSKSPRPPPEIIRNCFLNMHLQSDLQEHHTLQLSANDPWRRDGATGRCPEGATVRLRQCQAARLSQRRPLLRSLHSAAPCDGAAAPLLGGGA